jgi:hypothetical protein
MKWEFSDVPPHLTQSAVQRFRLPSAPMNPKSDAEPQPGDDLVVFSIVRESKCAECGEELFKGSLLRMEKEKPLCMRCADLDHLVFLPRGNVAITRRSRKYSALSAVVVRFSRSRGRYERQGLLVEPEAIARAEAESESDAEQRARARKHAAIVRDQREKDYLVEFQGAIRARFPGCPPANVAEIAHHACEKYSGRVGRSAFAKELDDAAVDLAVRAHIRHRHTDYDRLLNRGVDRSYARAQVGGKLAEVEARWRGGESRS